MGVVNLLKLRDIHERRRLTTGMDDVVTTEVGLDGERRRLIKVGARVKIKEQKRISGSARGTVVEVDVKDGGILVQWDACAYVWDASRSGKPEWMTPSELATC